MSSFHWDAAQYSTFLNIRSNVHILSLVWSLKMVNGGICLAWHFGTIYCHVELKVIVHVVLYVLYVPIWEFP